MIKNKKMADDVLKGLTPKAQEALNVLDEPDFYGEEAPHPYDMSEEEFSERKETEDQADEVYRSLLNDYCAKGEKNSDIYDKGHIDQKLLAGIRARSGEPQYIPSSASDFIQEEVQAYKFVRETSPDYNKDKDAVRSGTEYSVGGEQKTVESEKVHFKTMLALKDRLSVLGDPNYAPMESDLTPDNITQVLDELVEQRKQDKQGARR